MKDTEHKDIQRLREKSLWKDVKGRTLMVYRRWSAWNGTVYALSTVELMIVDDCTTICRPHKELATLIADGKMQYVGECSEKSPSGTVAYLPARTL